MTDMLLPAPRVAGDIEPQLTAMAEQRMLTPARTARYELALVGATVLPQRQVICRSAKHSTVEAAEPTRTVTRVKHDRLDAPRSDAFGSAG